MKRKFWNWIKNDAGDEEERTLVLNGEISDETWYGDEKQQWDWCVFKHTVTAGWLQKQLYYWFRYCTLLYRKKPQERRKQGVSGKEGRFLVCLKTH